MYLVKPCLRFGAMAVLSACLFCPVASSTAAALILPVSSEGSGGASTPVRDDPRTLQIAYASSLLTGLLPSSYITGLAFRLNDPYASWPSSERTWASYDIQLSTSLNAPGSLDPVFDANLGPDATTVRTGPLTIAALSYTGGSSPNAFGPQISFLNPYIYTGGDLLITIRHTGNGVDSQYMDSQTSILGQHQAQYAPGYTASTVGTNTIGTPVVSLSYSSVPEPSTYALLAMSAAGALWWARRRR